MKSNPQIRLLLDGHSPLDVFKCMSIIDAKIRFKNLRFRYDFPYWAAMQYVTPDRDDHSRIVPLFLNAHQQRLAEALCRRNFAGPDGVVLITKTTPHCGLTTCIQAFIRWRQLTLAPLSSLTLVPSDEIRLRLRRNLINSISRYPDPEYAVPVEDGYNRNALFASFSDPTLTFGKNLDLIHFADMSKWFDKSAQQSYRIYYDSIRNVRRSVPNLVIAEGDRPSLERLKPEIFRDNSLHEIARIRNLDSFADNPFFLFKYLQFSDPASSHHPDFIDIDRPTPKTQTATILKYGCGF